MSEIAVHLPDRGALVVAGPDREAFLQGLVSNDMARVTAGEAVYAVFLTAQGKFLHDFIVWPGEESWVIEAEGARIEDLHRRLRPYRLRSKVALDLLPEARIDVLLGGPAGVRGAVETLADGSQIAVDPRDPALGRRRLARDGGAPDLPAGAFASWEALRLSRGVPDGSRDMEIDKATAMESDLDRLNALSWDKGCYLGQELTARMKYRGLGKRRLVRVRIAEGVPEGGALIDEDGKEQGELRSHDDRWGLALVRTDALDKPLRAGAALIVPEPVAEA